MSNFLWEFNWNGDGSTWTNEADYALGGKFYLGFKPGLLPTDVVAEPGQFVMHLDNSTQRFSPDYASGALYGNLIPRRRFRLRRTDGVTTWPVWSGYIDKIEPQAGVYSERECVITCIDTPALLALSRVSMGLLRNRRADEIISIAVNLALGAPYALQTVTVSSLPSDGDAITITGVNGALTATWKNTIGATPNQIKIGASTSECAANLVAWVVAGAGSGTKYSSTSGRLEGITATASSNVVTLTSLLPGTIGNSFALSRTGTAITLGGASLTGGVDYPAGLMNYGTGHEAYDTSGDQWASSRTAALEIIADCCRSEQGRFFAQGDGTLTFLDRADMFAPLTAAVSLGSSSPVEVVFDRNRARVFNEVNVQVTPRAYVGTTGVLSQANTIMRIPPVDAAGNPGQRTVTLHFRDSAGNPCGGTNLVLPLVASTDYLVNDRPDGTGFDYSTSAAFAFGNIEVRGAEIIIPMLNYATGPLYVTRLQVRGQPITTYDPMIFTQVSASNQARDLKLPLTLPLPLSNDENYGQSLSLYLLDRYKDAFTSLREVVIRDQDTLGSTSVWAVGLFDVVDVSDAQMSVSGLKAFVTRIEGEIEASDFTLRWHCFRADDHKYWNLGVEGYGELGTNTFLGV
jgi:hypothetical protein